MKKVFMTNDGRIFETQVACRAYEDCLVLEQDICNAISFFDGDEFIDTSNIKELIEVIQDTGITHIRLNRDLSFQEFTYITNCCASCPMCAGLYRRIASGWKSFDDDYENFKALYPMYKFTQGTW